MLTVYTNSMKECVLVNSAHKIQCHIAKIHSYRLLFRRFCILGEKVKFWKK